MLFPLTPSALSITLLYPPQEMLDLLYDLDPIMAVLRSLFPQSTDDSISMKEFKSLLVEVGNVPSRDRLCVFASSK